MKKQLQGIAIILLSVLFMLGYGHAPFFDLSFRWSAIFTMSGIAGAVMTFLPDKEKTNKYLRRKKSKNSIGQTHHYIVSADVR